MNDAKAARKGKGDSKLLAAMNASLRDLRMRNRISAVKDAATGDEKIRCQIDVFGEFTEGPFAAAGGARLNNLLSWCLGAVMPWFLDQLTKDYGDWAAGTNVQLFHSRVAPHFFLVLSIRPFIRQAFDDAVGPGGGVCCASSSASPKSVI